MAPYKYDYDDDDDDNNNNNNYYYYMLKNYSADCHYYYTVTKYRVGHKNYTIFKSL